MEKSTCPPDFHGPHQKRRGHLLQALRIAAGLAIAVATAIYVMGFGGNALFVLGAYVLLIIACGPAMLKVLRVWVAIANGGEGILTILLLFVLIALLPLAALVFLALALLKAAFAGRNNKA
jgi:hypothetical protein